MAKILLGNKNNLYTATLNTGAKTLTFNNIIGWDMSATTLVSVYDSTTASYFTLGKNILSVTYSYVLGLPVWVVTLNVLPVGAANGDTLVILMNVDEVNAMYDILVVIAGATI